MTTLTQAQAALYDSDDARDIEAFDAEMRSLFGERDDATGAVEVTHPDGFVVGCWAGKASE